MEIDEQFIKNEEGMRLKVYDDGAGNRTVGVGHKLTPNEHFPNGEITPEQCEKLLQRDIGIALAHINETLKHPSFSTSQLTALVSLVFNCGSQPLLGAVGTLIMGARMKEAATAFLLYHHAHKPGIKCTALCDALLKRRTRERDLFLLDSH